MNVLQRISIVVLFFLGISNLSFAQAHYKFKPHNYINNIKVVGGLGLASYYGDLCHKIKCMRFRQQLSGGAMLRLTPNFSVRTEATYIRLFSTDKNGDNAKRNLNFKSHNLELSATVIYDIFAWNKIYGKRQQYVPYVFAGVGAFFYGPRTRYEGKSYSLRKLKTEGNSYSIVTTSIPFGGGVKYSLSPFIDIAFEIGYRKTFTDYIDDVSTNYVDNSSFSDPVAAALADRSFEGGYNPYGQSIDGEHAPEGARRGNPKKKDGYLIFGIKVDYTIKITKQFYNIHTHAPRYNSKLKHHHHR